MTEREPRQNRIASVHMEPDGSLVTSDQTPLLPESSAVEGGVATPREAAKAREGGATLTVTTAQDDLNADPTKPDPKTMKFLRILDEYRLKCEKEYNYKEAERANRQLENLRKQEEARQRRAVKARQLAEQQAMQVSQNAQYAEFTGEWDKYMQEYDEMAQMYVRQMNEKHAAELASYEAKLKLRPPKFSKELLEWRQRQKTLAKQKNYAEAQKIKRIADLMEGKERTRLSQDATSQNARKVATYKKRQQQELVALLKRVDGRRQEMLAQQALDTSRMLQHNRNAHAVLGPKQLVEERLAEKKIAMGLAPNFGGSYISTDDDEAPPAAALGPQEPRERQKDADADEDDEEEEGLIPGAVPASDEADEADDAGADGGGGGDATAAAPEASAAAEPTRAMNRIDSVHMDADGNLVTGDDDYPPPGEGQ